VYGSQCMAPPRRRMKAPNRRKSRQIFAILSRKYLIVFSQASTVIPPSAAVLSLRQLNAASTVVAGFLFYSRPRPPKARYLRSPRHPQILACSNWQQIFFLCSVDLKHPISRHMCLAGDWAGSSTRKEEENL
jgi:hypothetical protein